MDPQALYAAVSDADVGWLLAACAATAISLLAAVRNLTAFAPLRLRTREALQTQLAVCGLRIIAPSAVSTPAICARYLTRSGLGAAESLAVVGTAQAAQLLMTIAVVAALTAFGMDGVALPQPRMIALVAAVALAVLTVLIAASHRIGAVRRLRDAAVHAIGDIVTHARRRPLTIVAGLAASAALTLAHVATFACCVLAVGGHAPLLALMAIYLAAASAGSLIPTPAGIGPVEAAMIAGLVGTGLGAATATAAALLTRAITVYALAPPGWIALRSLRRRGLL